MLIEKPLRELTKPNVPTLFREIIHNDEQLRLTKSSQVVNFDNYKRHTQSHRDYMRAAEAYVFGTKDKGTKI